MAKDDQPIHGQDLPPPAHILIIDDDGQIRQLVAKFLVGNGLRVSTARDSIEMRDVLTRELIDLMVLDLMLPGKDGLEICRDLRKTSTMPIIMLTARGDDMDRVVGLEVGADDYLTKPFNPHELLARIRAVLRRSTGGNQVAAEVVRRHYVFDGWSVEPSRRELTDPDGVLVDLSGGEFDLLMALVESPNRILSRERLLEVARNRTANSFDRSVDVLMSRLRRKIERDGSGIALIKTVRGAGYLFLPRVERR